MTLSLFFLDAPTLTVPVSRPLQSSSMSSLKPSSLLPGYSMKPLVTQVYTRRTTIPSSDTPSSPDELSPSINPSSPDVSMSPSVSSIPIDLASLVESVSSPASTPEQSLRHNHRLRHPTACYSPSTFVTTVLSESASYHDAIIYQEWQHVMVEEIAALESTGTWELVSCPPCVCPITCKWVYRVKTRSNGSPERYKTCLVARDFRQEHGRDYDETSATVAHMAIICTLLVVASVRGWSISQLDVKNVFLNGEVREEVYMWPPLGYSIPEGMVCCLRRSLYSLKPTPRAWFQCFTYVVTTAGFSASTHDPALFVHMSSCSRALFLLYVDDMIITGDNPQFIAFVKVCLSEQFLMSDLGPFWYFLGIDVSSTLKGFSLRRNTSMGFLIGLLLLIIALLKLPWSSMFVFVPLMVSLFWILLIVVTL